MAYLELVQMKEDELQGDSRDYVERALQSSNTLLEMINALLDVNRFEQGRMPLDLEMCCIAAVTEKAFGGSWRPPLRPWPMKSGTAPGRQWDDKPSPPPKNPVANPPGQPTANRPHQDV